jgi:hypothetical protein
MIKSISEDIKARMQSLKKLFQMKRMTKRAKINIEIQNIAVFLGTRFEPNICKKKINIQKVIMKNRC